MNVHIGLEHLRNPTFFVYTIDERCRILKARNNFSAWFYLAHLHAITAHPLPDPFTGMTGTERALQILQSGFTWSSAPYDNESEKTLRHIANLSPRRSFYPEHLKCLQHIQWPDLINSSAAHDAFEIIVDKLLQDSNRLSFLHFRATSGNYQTTNRFLSLKAYWRHLNLYPNSKLSKDFCITQNFRSTHHHIVEKTTVVC